MRTILSLLIVMNLVAATGCRSSGPAGSTSVAVTATTTQVADFARNVAGDRAGVTQVLASNSDPHEYEPRPSDAEALATSDLIVRSGGDLDAWLDQVMDASGAGAPVLSLIDSVETRPDSEDGEDPHWWQDPRNAELAVGAIRDSLIDVDPDGAATYRANATSYVERLRELDRRIEACFDRVPEDERELVTSHDALGYYADRYGIEVVGAAIPALTTQAQASAGETADLVDLIEAAGVPVIFPEAGVSQELEATIADEAGASVGGELWADSLGPAGSGGETYLDAMAANTAELVAGFTGGAESCEIETGRSPDSSPAG